MIDRRQTDSVLDQRIANGEIRLHQLKLELQQAETQVSIAKRAIYEQTQNVLAMIEGRRHV